MKIVGVVVNAQGEAVFLACMDDVDVEGAKEIYADDGEGGLDTFTSFENHVLSPFTGMSDPELVDWLTKFNNGDFGEANFGVRLEDGITAVAVNPEVGNPIINAANGDVLYKYVMVAKSEEYDERDEYDEIIGVKAV